jgi:1,4-alpha-glucan branching enzyme
MRKGPKAKDTLVIAINLTPVVRENYRIGVPFKTKWTEIFNTDDIVYYGGGINNRGDIIPDPEGYNGQEYSIVVDLPPLAVTIFKSK